MSGSRQTMRQGPPPIHQRRSVWKGPVLALIALMAFLGAGAFLLNNTDLDPPEVARGNQITATMKRDFEKQLKITFPASTEYLFVLHEGFLDEMYDVKLRMSKADALTFLHRLPPGNFVSENSLQIVPHDPDWNPHLVRQFKAVSVDYSGGFLRVLVDTGDPNSATMYIEWFTT